MIDVLAQRDPCEQPRGRVATGHHARRRRNEQRRPATVQAVPVLWPHDLTLHQLRWNDIHFKCALFTDLLVEIRILLHRFWYDLDCLHHGKLREGLRWNRPRLPRFIPLVRDRLEAALGLRGKFFQFLQLKAQLRLIEPLTLPTAKQLLRQPGDLRAQRRILLPQQFDFISAGRGVTQTARIRKQFRAQVPLIIIFLYQRSYHAFNDPRLSSTPPISNASASGASASFARSSFGAGQEKRPSSSRFASTHTPVPSQYKSFSRVRSRLMNANTAPLFGSSWSCSLTALQSPLKDLRMSTGCTAT